ncbi:GNAT family N-acetyltransferase [Streptomyces natalensis]|uniref:GCN5 family acetyltransferase n=1 Tax=Streptomyces natalensis ATCC 27448 TaxID=1240678 RepID=A0A0D7CM73_9ACTN|nr:GNAT family N-acetyltransferase [Streptomyces natalensis]KIZ16547.1 GCN5 family acetyltransferase [Streptomyces natalensis ATCC 27448]
MTHPPYPLRSVTDEEFGPWACMIADTYGMDRSDEDLADQRAATDLGRTLAAFDGGEPVAGASVYSRVLTVPGGVIPVAGIASVGVAPTHRRRGILTAMMRRQLTDLHQNRREPIAALRPSEAGIYGRFGYGPATRGNRIRCDRRALRFRPDTDFGEGSVRLVPAARARPVIEQVYDQARTASVGWPDRQESHWRVRLADRPPARGTATALRFAVHRDSDGRATGYALYRHGSAPDGLGESTGVVRVVELAALSRQAYAALWRFLAGIDLATWIEYEGAVDEPLPHLLADPRALHSTVVDRLWVRPADVDRALMGRRYAVSLDLVLDVQDAFCPWNTGHHRLTADGGKVSCEPTTAPADLRMAADALGAAFLGGTTLTALAAAGLVQELRPGALALASTAFRGEREPWYPGGWAFPLY